MDILTPEHWTPSFWNKNDKKNDGIRFEDLIEVILKYGFNGSWLRTKTTHDGGRDFIRFDYNNKEVDWAECKMHSTNLPTTEIAKTLVMAVNNDINQILVFSYSRLTVSAELHLGNFASKTGKTIIIIDDRKLERFILKILDEDTFKKFFTLFKNKPTIEPLAAFCIKRFLCDDISISLNQFQSLDKEEEHTACVNIGKYYLYELHITSNLISETDIEIDFSNFYKDCNGGIERCILNLSQYIEEDELLQKINKKPYFYKRKVMSCEVFCIRLYFQPIFTLSSLPSINLLVNGNKYRSTPINISISKMIITPELIGGRLLEKIEYIGNEHSIYGRSKFYLISGNSGVGKSRFIHEIIGPILKYNYNIYAITVPTSGRLNRFPYFLAELLTQIYKIPNPHQLNDDCNSIELFSLNEDDSSNQSLLFSILERCINEAYFSDEVIKKEIIPIIKKELFRTKSALFIDDVQHLDKQSIYLLSQLQLIQGQTEQCSLFYVFNTEIIDYKSDAGYMYQNLSKKTADNHIIIIPDFSSSMVEQFINSTIRLNNNQYFSKEHNELYQAIVKAIPHRPFYLHQFISHLLDEDIITFCKDKLKLYIADIVKLDNLLTTLSGRQIEILDIRFNGLSEPYLAVIEVLKYIGELDKNFFGPLQDILTDHLVSDLIEWNILKINNNTLTFVHSLMEKYVLENDITTSEVLSKEIRAKIGTDKQLRKQYPLSVFSNCPKEDLFDEVVVEINKCSETTFRNVFYANKVLSFIYNNTHSISPDRYLANIMKIAILASHNDKAIFRQSLEMLNNFLKDYMPSSDKMAGYYIEIIREYGSFLTVTNDFVKSIAKLNDGLKRLETFNISISVKFELKSRLTNRIGVAHKQNRELSKALDVTLQALHLAKESGSVIMQCLSHIDLGYIYYGLKSEKLNLSKHWNQTIELYKKNKSTVDINDVDTSFACQLTDILLIGINGNYKQASKGALLLMKDSQLKMSAYYELQSRRAKVFFDYMLDNSDKHIETQLNELIVLSRRYQLYKYYIFAYHLKALFYINKGDTSRAAIEFNNILEVLDTENFTNNVSIEIWFLLNDIKTFNEKYKGMSCSNLNYTYKITEIEKRLEHINFPPVEDSLFYDGTYCTSLP